MLAICCLCEGDMCVFISFRLSYSSHSVHSFVTVTVLVVCFIYTYIYMRACVHANRVWWYHRYCLYTHKENFRVLWRDKTVANVGVVCVLITEIMGQ